MFAKDVKNSPNWQNFTKSGHSSMLLYFTDSSETSKIYFITLAVGYEDPKYVGHEKI